MATKSESLKKWISKAAVEFNVPYEVAESIYNSQMAFIRENLTNKGGMVNMHITGLGKFYYNTEGNGKFDHYYRRVEKPGDEEVQHPGSAA